MPETNISSRVFFILKCGLGSGVLSPVHRKIEVSGKKKQVGKKQTGTKLLVRNVPFQATVKEIRELFW